MGQIVESSRHCPQKAAKQAMIDHLVINDHKLQK